LSYLRNFRREVLQAFGLQGDESPRFVLEVAFGAIAVATGSIIAVFLFEKQPSHELRHAAFISFMGLIIVIVFSKYKPVLFIGILVFIGFRLFIGAVFFHYWPGFLFAGLCLCVALVIAKFSLELWK